MVYHEGMSWQLSLDELWSSTPSSHRIFDPSQISHLPEAARRYLEHSIAAGTPLALAVRLQMHGEIKLKGWFPFSAEQVIRWDRGMIWAASVKMYGLPVRGADRWLDGSGEMRWKLFGILPIVTASGPDINRSGAGRINIESLWLPSALCCDEVAWTASDALHPHARFTAHGETAELDYALEAHGRLEALQMTRWGNPDGGEFRYASFGGFVEQDDTFDGYTIPTRVRVGWNFGAAEFESTGEFFRATIDEAAFC